MAESYSRLITLVTQKKLTIMSLLLYWRYFIDMSVVVDVLSRRTIIKLEYPSYNPIVSNLYRILTNRRYVYLNS